MRIATLARLDITPEDADVFAPQLAGILAYADAVQQVDTSTVSLMSADGQHDAAMRADEPRPTLARTEVMAQAPDARDDAGLYRVPRVL